ncbi:uncharacterized protein LOC143447284 [Clavelina lepadiformis]|uniref:Uncharacterized protein n=1 Tax=Clavelina lepadiformis TaxID=159417 RepID=A0ABP0FF81_CLALP
MPRNFSQKNPLVLMDSKVNGPVHAYGSPVLKSMNPCTAKTNPHFKANVKWVSPQFIDVDSSSLKRRQKSSRINVKVANDSKQDDNKEMKPKPKASTKCHVYPKLEFVKKTDTKYSSMNSEDNKENIRPESEFPYSETPSSRSKIVTDPMKKHRLKRSVNRL